MSDTMKQTEQKPATQVDVSGRMLARNTILILAGRIAPLLVAIFATPYVIHHLGPDRYGLYSLAWIVVGYLTLFNLGIGPASTKYVAEYLGRGDIDKLPKLVWTAIASQTFLGAVGGILLAAASPFLVQHVLKIPADLQFQAHVVFLIMAAALPVDFASGSVQGVLGASQRFDLQNAISVPSGLLSYLLPVVVLALGFGLPAVVFSLVLLRVASMGVALVLVVRLYPALRAVRLDLSLLRPLLSFGGWITVSSITGPILVYFDRVLIGAIASVAAVGFYAPPYLIISKMWILPGSLMGTLFPAFSASAGRGDSEWIRRTLVRSLKFLLLLVGPVTLILIFFAEPLLSLWLGARYAIEGTLVLQILAIGALLNSLARVPAGLLQGIGRPDLTAMFHVAELPIHIALVWLLILHFGLPGAALAWTFRMTLDFVLLIIAACRVTRTSPRLLASRDLRRSLGALATLAVGLVVLWSSTHTFIADAAITLLLSAGFLLTAWRYALNMEERWKIRLWLKLAR